MDRRDLQELAKLRLRESTTLLQVELFDGAYYLAGYTVECALKACIAKGTKRHEFPDRKNVESSHSHNLRDLMKVAGLEDARVERARADAEFRTNWEVVQTWSKRDARLSLRSRRPR